MSPLHYFVAQLLPTGMDFIGHFFIAGILILWWLSRGASDSDDSVRAEYLPLEHATSDSLSVPKTKRRRVPVTLAALVALLIVGTAIPIYAGWYASHTGHELNLPGMKEDAP